MKNRLNLQLQGFLTTPPLWQDEFLGLKQFQLPEPTFPPDFDIAAEIPSITNNYVLGKRVESFFELVLRNTKNYEILAQNIQIQKEKITLGELDFLLKDLMMSRFFHIEKVYKFYVYDPSFENEMQRWIGPNRKDSFLQKIEKLKKRQLPLLFNPETASLLSKFDLQPTDLEQQVCFKANLFIQKNLKAHVFPQINTSCIVGFWIHFEEFTSEQYGAFQYFAPSKQDWPVRPEFNEKWSAYAEIKIQLLQMLHQKRSPLIWIKKNEFEFERIFIVWW